MSNQIELRHLRYFLAVAEDLHFRKAADKLFISQPGLSKQIKQLEDDLGVKLFERHNRKVELTATGVYMKDAIAKNLKNLESIYNHARLLDDGVEGSLNFGYVGSAMQEVIPSLLLEYSKIHPNVVFSLNEMDNNRQIQSLLEQDIDLGFVRTNRVPKGLEVMPVFEDTFSLVLPKSHKLDESNFKDLSQLEDEPFILFDTSYSESYHEVVMQIFDNFGFVPQISHYTVNAGSIFRLVENNLGISIVPTTLKLGYNMDIKFIELKNIPQRTILRAIWNKNNSNKSLKSILEIVRLKK
jgi:DNA-binding transcriptional LysR family regulator